MPYGDCICEVPGCIGPCVTRAKNRTDYIRTRVRKSLESLAQDALYWDETPRAAFDVEPLWHELRDTIASVLFDMDREQSEHEQHAAHVVKDCL